jgi:DNA-binding beta-propeller fold protein YncE
MKLRLIIIFLLGTTLASYSQFQLIWLNDSSFKSPESVAYDANNKCLYVSNFNKVPGEGEMYNEDYISKVDLNGKVLVQKFIKNLTAPTGISVSNHRLYIVERNGIVKFNLETGKIENRFWVPKTFFLNDIDADSIGTIYFSDSGRDIIYRIKNNKLEKWLESDEIPEINGVFLDGDKLIVAANGDSTLKSINIIDKKVTTIAHFKKGILDGIKKIGNDYLVSHFEGNLYRVKQNGEVSELLNSRNEKIFCADFEYIDELKLLVVPALWNSMLICYMYENIKK